MYRRIATLLIGLPLLLPLEVAASEKSIRGTLETVAELSINPGNLAVTAEGRVFATVHQFRRANAQLIEITGSESYEPWLQGTWNGTFGSGPDVLNSPLGVAIDRKGRLWVIDNGLGNPPQPPKLLAFSLADGSLSFRYDFPTETGPTGSFLNDLAVDEERGFVYIADVRGSHKPALVWLNLSTKTSRRFTESVALQAENVDLVVEGRLIGIKGNDGQVKPARIGVNPITLSADGETLYFGAMNGKTWYRLPTHLLREGSEDKEIAAAIERAGAKPISDGASTEAEGNHFFTNLAHNGIRRVALALVIPVGGFCGRKDSRNGDNLFVARAVPLRIAAAPLRESARARAYPGLAACASLSLAGSGCTERTCAPRGRASLY